MPALPQAGRWRRSERRQAPDARFRSGQWRGGHLAPGPPAGHEGVQVGGGSAASLPCLLLLKVWCPRCSSAVGLATRAAAAPLRPLAMDLGPCLPPLQRMGRGGALRPATHALHAVRRVGRFARHAARRGGRGAGRRSRGLASCAAAALKCAATGWESAVPLQCSCRSCPCARIFCRASTARPPPCQPSALPRHTFLHLLWVLHWHALQVKDKRKEIAQLRGEVKRIQAELAAAQQQQQGAVVPSDGAGAPANAAAAPGGSPAAPAPQRQSRRGGRDPAAEIESMVQRISKLEHDISQVGRLGLGPGPALFRVRVWAAAWCPHLAVRSVKQPCCPCWRLPPSMLLPMRPFHPQLLLGFAPRPPPQTRF